MKDWKGNTIVAGQTIIFVSTKPAFKNLGWFIPKGNGEFDLLPALNQPPEHCWDCSQEYQTEEREGKLYYGGNEYDGNVWWFQFDESGFFRQPSTILCIKGVSDSEEEYYKEFFKA